MRMTLAEPRMFARRSELGVEILPQTLAAAGIARALDSGDPTAPVPHIRERRVIGDGEVAGPAAAGAAADV
jgi:hypothetical protein